MIKVKEENIINALKNQGNVMDLYSHSLRSKENNGKYTIITKAQIYLLQY